MNPIAAQGGEGFGGVRTKSAVILAALLITACAPPAPAPLPQSFAYVCQDGRALQAVYPDAATARLTENGVTHILRAGRAASGVRYVGAGLQWWTKGEQARLSRLEPGEAVAEDPGVLCQPPDRAPGSARGAAKVAADYYALVESGKLTEASRLRRDGVVEDVAPFATLAAEVGAPGPVEGAAGSLYVQVPVVLYGRYVTGGAYRRAGQVTLRRVNSVPGATAAQLSWRIERIELRP